MKASLRDLASDETGSIFVVGAILLVVFALLGGAVLEIGQWFEHRRALQVRTDAATLAGGQALAECFNVGVNGFTKEMAAQDMEAWAEKYGGATSPYNKQFVRSSDLMWFQSSTYPSAGETNAAALGNECDQLMLDVKTTQSGIPPFLSISPFATVHGWARVQLQEIEALIPSMPLAVPDVRPKQVAVTFVNNATGNALSNCPNGCVFQLGGPTQSGQLNDWGANVTIPASAIAAADMNIGMRVGLGSQVGSCANTTGGSTYRCYDYGGPGGIIDLRSYNPTGGGSTSAPVLRAVTPTTCSGTPFFSVYQAAADGTCTADVAATIDFGAGADLSQAQVTGKLGSTTLTFSHSTGNTWVSNAVSLPISQGPYPVTLAWAYGSGKSKTSGNFNSGSPVQQIFSGSDGSSPNLPGGPIFAAMVAGSGGNASYSFPANHDATLAVTIGLSGGVHLPDRCSNGTSGGSYSCATDRPVLLRFTTGSGNDSQTYAIDCGGGNLRDMIENGCVDQYSINDADVCPDPTNTSQYPDCAPVQTGAATGQVQQGMNARFAPNNQCLPNNYPAPPPGDPRAVTLIITDFSAFSGSGGSWASDVPVVTYATFYITGWDGAPATNSCASNNEPAPPDDPTKGQGSNIWGHFIADVTTGTPNGKTCPGAGVAPCVPALVR